MSRRGDELVVADKVLRIVASSTSLQMLPVVAGAVPGRAWGNNAAPVIKKPATIVARREAAMSGAGKLSPPPP